MEDGRQRRLEHIDRLRQVLQTERKRVMDYLLPNRYTLHGTAQVFLVAVEIRLPT
ncbi:MAG: hypothetical protein WCJ56_02335 [bacterium]